MFDIEQILEELSFIDSRAELSPNEEAVGACSDFLVQPARGGGGPRIASVGNGVRP